VHLRLEGQLQQLDLVLVKLVVDGEVVCGRAERGQRRRVSNKIKIKRSKSKSIKKREGEDAPGDEFMSFSNMVR